MAFETKNNFQNSDKIKISNQAELYFKISEYPKESIGLKTEDLFGKENISDIFKSIVENSNEGILLFKDDYTILYVILISYTSNRSNIGRPFRFILKQIRSRIIGTANFSV